MYAIISEMHNVLLSTRYREESQSSVVLNNTGRGLCGPFTIIQLFTLTMLE